MNLEVIRFSSGTDSTNGILLNKTNNEFLAYTLEDEYRSEKVYGGGYHAKYAKRFSDFHIGMLHVLDVPNFEYILIHCGNTDEHTAGCLLVGDSQENNQITKNGFIGKSTQAYKRIYPRIAEAIECGEQVTITYKSL